MHFNLAKLGDLFKAVRATVAELEGAYALAVVSEHDPDRIIVARVGCPVVLGLGVGENFVASDVAALLPVTRRFMFLDEGDVAEIQRSGVRVIDRDGNSADRPVKDSELSADAAEKGQYRHFMLKEIHEQPRAVANTLQERVANGRLLEAAFGPAAARGVRARRGGAHRRLRHQLSRRRGRALLHRADLPHPVPRRDRERVPLPQPGGAAELAVRRRSRSRARPPTRWRRCAWRAQQRLPVDARDLQLARELAGARVRAGHADARRPGDRRGLDQGVHHAAHGAVDADHRAGAPQRLAIPSASARWSRG